MGRHSDPDPRWFWLSLATTVGKALAVALLLVGAVFGVTRLLGSADEDDVAVPLTEPSRTTGTTPAAADATEPTGRREVPTRTPDRDTTSDDASEREHVQEGGDDAPVRGTVQVLNASGDAGVLRDVIAVLEEVGFQVVAEGRASRAYARTTVFWSDGHEDEAEELRDADERFAVIQRNERLDPTIDLHVVVGRDWAASEPAV